MRPRLPLLLIFLLLMAVTLAPLPTGAQIRRPVLILLRERADLSFASSIPLKQERGKAVDAALRRQASRTQPAVMALLRAHGSEGQTLLTANAIAAEVDEQTVALLRRHPAVAAVIDDRPRRMLLPPQPDLNVPDAPQGLEWGIVDINADDVWATYGVTGTGVVVAGNDTGVQWNHPALIRSYRGWTGGSSADHNYSWHDGVDELCGSNSATEPCDDYGHGSHTVGTMVGDDGQGNQIGVAPGASWIGCRNMAYGNGTIASYMECFDWFLAPTDLAGNNSRPDLAPDIINNSWGCPPSEGCVTAEQMAAIEPSVQALSAAGILVVASAGNGGVGGCQTIVTPPAIYPDSLVVGAHVESGSIASFSSRGPISYNGDQRIGPDLTAPGNNVRSAYNNGGYTTMNGTSMAAPHVAGAAALLWSARPELKGQIELTKQILLETARPTSARSNACDGDPTSLPNNVFGWGRLDALAAVQKALTTGTLTVTVTRNSVPMTWSPVTIEGDYDFELAVDAQGQLGLPLPSGTYTVSVPWYGQELFSQTVVVMPDTAHTLTLELPGVTLFQPVIYKP